MRRRTWSAASPRSHGPADVPPVRRLLRRLVAHVLPGRATSCVGSATSASARSSIEGLDRARRVLDERVAVRVLAAHPPHHRRGRRAAAAASPWRPPRACASSPAPACSPTTSTPAGPRSSAATRSDHPRPLPPPKTRTSYREACRGPERYEVRRAVDGYQAAAVELEAVGLELAVQRRAGDAQRHRPPRPCCRRHRPGPWRWPRTRAAPSPSGAAGGWRPGPRAAGRRG